MTDRVSGFLAAGVAGMVLIPGMAFAEERGALYLRAFGGLSQLAKTDLTTGSGTTALSFDRGTLAGAAFGYDYTGPWRAELEFAYRSGEATGTLPEGELASTTVMISGLYSLGSISSVVQPYVGLGLGYVTEVDFDLSGTAAAGEYSDRGRLAGQIILGAVYEVSSNWQAFGELRYFATQSPQLRNDAGDTISADYRSLDVALGISFRF